jgi:ankyrin repeat protein
MRRKAIRQALERLPNGLDRAYEDTMKRIKGKEKGLRELAEQVLLWITCAKRPLMTKELRHALGVEVGELALDEDNIPETKDIISVCAGLVTVDEESNIIRLVHYTMQEYFERTWKDWFPNAQTDIAITCITYLLFDAFEAGFCPTDDEFEKRLQLYPLYDYSARNWGHHACAASIEVEQLKLEQLILDLLESENKVSSSCQAMMASRRYSWESGYSQNVPKQMTGAHLAAYFGLSEAIITLFRDRHNPNIKDTYGRTPLLWAAQMGHEAVAKLLLEKGAKLESIDKKHGRTPLSWAAESGHVAVAKLLLEKGAELEPKGRSGLTPLWWAAQMGHEAVVKLLLEKGVDPESKNKYGPAPLQWAARNGHEAVVKLLLEKGAELESKDKDGWTPLRWAARNGHKAVVKLLLEKGADLESKDKDGRTPLRWAIKNGHEAVVKMLLEKGAKLEFKDNEYGRTPLRWLIENGHEAVVKLLLEKGADLESKDNDGRTLL